MDLFWHFSLNSHTFLEQNMAKEKLVTLAIHTLDRAKMLKAVLEAEGIETEIVNLNFLASGVRIRIHESDLQHALQIIETIENNAVHDEVKRILIPIDFSAYSQKVCEVGFRFAKKIDAEVILMHAYYLPEYSIFARGIEASSLYDFSDVEQRRTTMIKSESADFKQFVGEIESRMERGELPVCKFMTLMEEGIPEDVIVEASQKYNPELIVMGTRGKNVEDIELLGSVTAEVMERTKVPVLAIPKNVNTERFEGMKNIVYATSLDNRMLMSIDVVMKLFKDFSFKLFVTHFEKKEDAWNEIKLVGLKDYFKRMYTNVAIEYALLKPQNNDLLTAFDEFVKTNAIDLIILNTHRRSIFMNLFYPSMARKMLFHTDTPILVVRS